jgi:hypothetical protein
MKSQILEQDNARRGRAASAIASGPMQSLAKTTGPPISSPSRAATGFKLISALGLPFGRPRCDASTTHAAPASSACVIVGSEARILVSSPMTPFLSGTLKSTRTNTRRSFRRRSRIDRFFTGLSRPP